MGFFSYKHPIMARVYAYSHKYTLNPESTFKLIKTIVNLPKSAFVLDVGGGTGTHAEFFVGEGHKVVVLDPSKEMLAFIRNKTIIKRVGTANNLPFENNVFDIVFTNFVLHHFVDTFKPLGEIFKVLKKNGYLIATLVVYDIPENLSIPLNIQVPIRLGAEQDTVLVHNTLKSYKQVEKDLRNANFKIETYIPINNANARMDISHPYKDKVKLMTMLIIAKK